MKIMLALSGEDERGKAADLVHAYVCEMLTFVGVDNPSAEQVATGIALVNAYWKTADHYPFLIYCDNELVGFSLVRRYPADTSLYDMGQFFISDSYKGKGIGREAFYQTLARFPGAWLIRVLPENLSALQFWKKVIAEATQGEYRILMELDKDLEVHFIRFSV